MIMQQCSAHDGGVEGSVDGKECTVGETRRCLRFKIWVAVMRAGRSWP